MVVCCCVRVRVRDVDQGLAIGGGAVAVSVVYFQRREEQNFQIHHIVDDHREGASYVLVRGM